MVNKEISDKVKKNLLDIHYNKYLSYFNTTIILLFSYIIALLIGFITSQIDYRNTNQVYAVSVFSFIIIYIFIMFLLNFRDHLRKIPKEIKKLKL